MVQKKARLNWDLVNQMPPLPPVPAPVPGAPPVGPLEVNPNLQWRIDNNLVAGQVYFQQYREILGIPQVPQEEPRIDPFEPVPDPGPRPVFPKRPEGLSLGEAIELNRWTDSRSRYLEWLRHQPEPVLEEYESRDQYMRAVSNWIEAGGVEAPKVKIHWPPKEIRKLNPRGEATPRFVLPYSPEEMRLRLRGTIVTIDDRPCYVQQAGENVRDSENKSVVSPGLVVMYSDGSSASIVPRLHTLDCRSFEPGYIQRNPGYAELYVRHPARIYRQGINPENCRILDAVSLNERRGFGDYGGISSFMKAMEDRNDTKRFSRETVSELTGVYKEAGGGVQPSIRLSNKVLACIKDKSQKVQILFKGVSCCVIDTEGNSRFDTSFCSLPSVSAELESVNVK